MITEVFTDNIYYQLFDGMSDVFEHCKHPHSTCREWMSYERTGKHFHCWQQVLDEAKLPSESTVEHVQSMIEQLEDDVDIPQPMVHKRRPRFRDNDGDEIDLDRLRGGQDYWRVCERQASVGSQVKTIIINMSTRVGILASDIHWRGAAALTLCHLLEAAGYQCEIWAVSCNYGTYVDGTGHFDAIRLKDCYGAIDIDTISTVISGWFFRSIWFNMSDRDIREAPGGGRPRRVSTSDLEILVPNTSVDDVFLVEEVFSYYNAINKVKTLLKQYAEPDEADELYTEETEALVESEPYVPPKPKTMAERRREERERRQAEREYQRRVKAWKKMNRSK